MAALLLELVKPRHFLCPVQLARLGTRPLTFCALVKHCPPRPDLEWIQADVLAVWVVLPLVVDSVDSHLAAVARHRVCWLNGRGRRQYYSRRQRSLVGGAPLFISRVGLLFLIGGVPRRARPGLFSSSVSLSVPGVPGSGDDTGT